VTGNLLAEWSRLIFGTLRAAGVRDVVVSPGSRSTPFAYAALTTPGLVCHSAWDERSAGFFALGQARLTGRPSAVLSTSGSAVVNYHPAVAEAAYAHVPLVVLSADRPFELQEVGAAQCMDQVKVFGGLVRRYLDLGHPDAGDVALDAAQRAVARTVLEAMAPNPGPVHLNLRARKPLEPRGATTEVERALERAVTSRLDRGPGQLARGRAAPPNEVLSELGAALKRHGNGLIVLGPAAAGLELEPVFELSARTGYPLCAEAPSQARFARPRGFDDVVVIGGLDALLEVSTLVPDFVLELGGTPTSSSFERLARSGAFERAVVNPYALVEDMK
jgi:2-succinyl-5-enolpyruvyl-6-hydroxy-3-cyclohexene-1-carboxylate synthase